MLERKGWQGLLWAGLSEKMMTYCKTLWKVAEAQRLRQSLLVYLETWTLTLQTIPEEGQCHPSRNAMPRLCQVALVLDSSGQSHIRREASASQVIQVKRDKAEGSGSLFLVLVEPWLRLS